MKFKLEVSGYSYPNKEDRERLKKIGFSFEKQENMGIEWFRIKGEPEIEINSLEELIEFSNTHGEIIVKDGCIEIYDDCRED